MRGTGIESVTAALSGEGASLIWYLGTLAVLLSLWSYDGLIARYPNAIIELKGYPYGS